MRFSRPTKLLALVGAAAVVGSLAPAGAAVAPRFTTERTYVHCGATDKASVVDFVKDNKLPTWNTTAPTKSVQQGAGCGTFDAPVLGWAVAANQTQPVFDMVWEGKFKGNLDSLTVHAHAIWMGPGKLTEQALDEALAGLTVELWVDGQSISLPLNADGDQEVEPTVIPSTTGASSEFVFTIDDLNFIEPVVDADLDGVADNAGTTEHTVRLALATYWLDSNPLMVWVWDTTDVPSGIEFNPATLTAPVLARQP